MKVILLLTALTFSSFSYAAQIKIDQSYDNGNPLADSTITCDGNTSDVNSSGYTSCTSSFNAPYVVEGVLDYVGQGEDTESYFYDGLDLIERDMYIGSQYEADERMTLKISWTGNGVTDSFVSINGELMPVVNGLSDYVLYDVIMAAEGDRTFFNLSIFGQAFIRDAFLSYTVSVYNPNVSEVPIPAALYLFAPALLGFMGLRRKAKIA